jgi:signal transduction histidine kinase
LLPLLEVHTHRRRDRCDVTDSDSTATIQVRDAGMGLAAAQTARAFESSFRAAREAHGLGLGLVIARHFVERHGGTIEVEREGLNRGSTFIIRLPAFVDASSPSPVVPV